MTYIAHNLEEFARGCIDFPNARLKANGNQITFLSNGEKAVEAVKDFGRWIANGFSVKNVQSNDTYGVVEVLARWRRQTPKNNPWSGFGRENLSRPDINRVSLPVRDVLENKSRRFANVQGRSDENILTDALTKLYRYEKRLWAFDHGATSKSTWNDVAARSGAGDNISLNNTRTRGGDLVFAQDAANEFYDQTVEGTGAAVGNAKALVNNEYIEDDIFAEFTAEMDYEAPVERLFKSNETIESVSTKLRAAINEVHKINAEIIKAGSAHQPENDTTFNAQTNQYNGINTLNERFEAAALAVRINSERIRLLIDITKADLQNERKTATPARIAHLKAQIEDAKLALGREIPDSRLTLMRGLYWSRSGHGLPANKVTAFIDMANGKVVNAAEIARVKSLDGDDSVYTSVTSADAQPAVYEIDAEYVNKEAVVQAWNHDRAITIFTLDIKNYQKLTQDIAVLSNAANHDDDWADISGTNYQELLESKRAERQRTLASLIRHVSLDSVKLLSVETLGALLPILQAVEHPNINTQVQLVNNELLRKQEVQSPADLGYEEVDAGTVARQEKEEFVERGITNITTTLVRLDELEKRIISKTTAAVNFDDLEGASNNTAWQDAKIARDMRNAALNTLTIQLNPEVISELDGEALEAIAHHMQEYVGFAAIASDPIARDMYDKLKLVEDELDRMDVARLAARTPSPKETVVPVSAGFLAGIEHRIATLPVSGLISLKGKLSQMPHLGNIVLRAIDLIDEAIDRKEEEEAKRPAPQANEVAREPVRYLSTINELPTLETYDETAAYKQAHAQLAPAKLQ